MARHRDASEVDGALLAIARLAPQRELSLPAHAIEFVSLIADEPEPSQTRELARRALDGLRAAADAAPNERPNRD